MAFTIAANIGTTAANTGPTGRPCQGHLSYAVNQGAYWILFLNSASSTTALSARYSTNNGGSWSTPTGSPFTLVNAHNGMGPNLSCCYKNISSVDVLHFAVSYRITTTNRRHYHTRSTLGTTWTLGTETETGTVLTSSDSYADPDSGATTFDSANGKMTDLTGYVYDGSVNYANFMAIRSTTEAATTWDANSTNIFTASATIRSAAAFDIGSSNILGITDNGNATTSFTQLEWSKWTSSWSAAATVLASTVTAADFNAWGACALSTSDVHVVALSNNSNAYVHRRFNGTSWSSSSGAPGALTYGTGSGISLVSDGTSLWAAAIDTSKNIQYNKWTSAGGWGGWTILEAARTNTPSYITGCYNSSNNEIMWAWSEVNGSNFDIIGSTLSAAAGAFMPHQPLFVPQAIRRAAYY